MVGLAYRPFYEMLPPLVGESKFVADRKPLPFTQSSFIYLIIFHLYNMNTAADVVDVFSTRAIWIEIAK
jgi:hypothetical protein